MKSQEKDELMQKLQYMYAITRLAPVPAADHEKCFEAGNIFFKFINDYYDAADEESEVIAKEREITVPEYTND